MSDIPHDDRGLLLGDGLFETVLARDGALVLWPDHLARLTAGCRRLGLPEPDPVAALAACEQAVALRPSDRRIAVRLTLTAGSGGRGLDRPVAPAIRMFAIAAPAVSPTGPAELVTVSVRRNADSPASQLKTLSYLDNVLARREAEGAEALMLNTRGEIACAAAANLFWFCGDRLQTPAPGCGVLAGVMRRQVLLAAGALGLVFEEVAVGIEALESATGLFLTNSLIGVRPVIRRDGRTIAPHPAVARLKAAVAAVS